MDRARKDVNSELLLFTLHCTVQQEIKAQLNKINQLEFILTHFTESFMDCRIER